MHIRIFGFTERTNYTNSINIEICILFVFILYKFTGGKPNHK